jgi:hypothetical protein
MARVCNQSKTLKVTYQDRIVTWSKKKMCGKVRMRAIWPRKAFSYNAQGNQSQERPATI